MPFFHSSIPKYAFVEIAELLKLITWIAGGCKCGSPLGVPHLSTKYKGGTDILVKISCTNPACKEKISWHSQSCVGNTQYRSGNVDLISSILISGATRIKIIRLLTMMGSAVFSTSTYDFIQSNFVFPAINEHHDKMMKDARTKRKDEKKNLYVSGDARHDSPGKSVVFSINL